MTEDEFQDVVHYAELSQERIQFGLMRALLAQPLADGDLVELALADPRPGFAPPELGVLAPNLRRLEIG